MSITCVIGFSSKNNEDNDNKEINSKRRKVMSVK
jgi:hypothetical protein